MDSSGCILYTKHLDGAGKYSSLSLAMAVHCRVTVVLLGVVGLLLINVHLFHRYSENDSGNKAFVDVDYSHNAEQLNTSKGMGHII